MKQISALFLMMSVAVAAQADEFMTSGEGKAYTFGDVAALSPESVTKAGNIYTVSTDFTVAEGDTLLLLDGEQVGLGDGVSITIDGVMDFEPATSALVTRANAEAAPKGFRVTGDNAIMKVKNVVFEYVAFNHMSNFPIEAYNCTFRYANTSLTSTGAIAMLRTTVGNVFEGCRFVQNESSAIGGSALSGTGMRIENCYFFDNNTSNTNKPQLNLIGGGDESIIIRNCTFLGTGRTMVGAIGFMNYYVPGENLVLIENNLIQNHRYGIGAYSYCPLNMRFVNNQIVNNDAEVNPNNGGSGISLYDYGEESLNAYAEGNYIAGNVWGVTLLGKIGNINFGKTEDKEAEDYNPGRNVFENNGNGGVLYDFFDNTSNDAVVYAQGNIWGVAQQDSVSIASVVWDGNDQGGHGEVIFMAPQTDVVVALNAIAAERPSKSLRYDVERGELVQLGDEDVRIFGLNGVLMLEGKGQTIDVKALGKGSYLASSGSGDVVKFVKK